MRAAEEEFDELCFQYGVELDDVVRSSRAGGKAASGGRVHARALTGHAHIAPSRAPSTLPSSPQTSEKEMLRNMHGGAGSATAEAASEEVIYKIDIPANRYDMLCLEGIARALNVFRAVSPAPAYALADMAGRAPQRITVKPETALVRPFIVAAVLRGVTLSQAAYDSFIELQDKLHQNLCRQRALVAIGTHDLDAVSGPFTYEALPPGEVHFVPLKQTRSFAADALLEHYAATDQKLRRFVPLLAGSKVVPVVLDSQRSVLSLPPVINGAQSALSLATRNVLVECTATDLTKAGVVLNTVVTMFSE